MAQPANRISGISESGENMSCTAILGCVALSDYRPPLLDRDDRPPARQLSSGLALQLVQGIDGPAHALERKHAHVRRRGARKIEWIKCFHAIAVSFAKIHHVLHADEFCLARVESGATILL